jgi:hypothetical protein
MAVHPPHRHRQRVQKFTQPRTARRRKSFAHIDSLNFIVAFCSCTMTGHAAAPLSPATNSGHVTRGVFIGFPP